MIKLKIAAFIASLFSIVFSMSIIKELSEFIDIDILIASSIFIGFILLMNEFFKIRCLYKKFNHENYSILVLSITFSLSIILSSIGINFWIDKSSEYSQKNEITFNESKFEIINTHSLIIDSISNIDINSRLYNQYHTNLEFWKNRNCHSTEERIQARENIKKIENEIKALQDNHKTDLNEQIKRTKELRDLKLSKIQTSYINTKSNISKSNFLFVIFFTLVLLTELMIIYIQLMISNFYTQDQKRNMKILYDLLQKKKEIIKLDDIRYNLFFNPQLSKDLQLRQEALNFMFLLGDLDIIKKEKPDNGKIVNKNRAYNNLKLYYNKINAL